MKIVFLARLFYPHIGGVEKHVFEISKRLIAKKHTVIIVTEQFEQALPSHEIFENIEIYRISTGRNDWFKKFRLWKEMWRLHSVIKQADVIHCHDVFFWYLPFRFLFPQKPVYTTFHGYESFPIRQGAMVMRKISEKLSWGNICIGDFMKKWYRTTPTIVSYGAVDIKSHQSFNLRHEALKTRSSALFYGRLDEQTGVIGYMEAVTLIKKKYPKFDFFIVGDGEYKESLRKKTKVIGFEKDPEKYFPRYHFAFLSRYLSILEAFAAKRMVFALYDNPVKEDYLKMTPYAASIVIANTPEKLAEKVVYFLEHPTEEKKLIAKNYEWVKKQSWEKMTELYLTLWKKK